MQNDEYLFPKWYKKTWGKIFIITGSVIVVAVIVFLFYVGYLVKKIEAGELTPEFAQKFENSQQADSADKYYVDTLDDPYLGNPDADLVIVEFADFKCPYCAAEFPVVRELAATYPNDIKIIFRDFPVNYDSSKLLAMAAECAAEQDKFWQFHDYLFMNQTIDNLAQLQTVSARLGLNENKFYDCVNSEKYKTEVEQDLADGLQATVVGTPTFFINGYKIEGSIPIEEFKQMIDVILAAY